MRKRDITRIQYKLHDLKEYEAMKAAKQKESRGDKSGSTLTGNDSLTTPVPPKTRSELINQRIGVIAAAAAAEPMD